MLISCKQYARAIEILTETEFYELTHYFLQFCLRNQLIEIEIKSTEEAAHESKDHEKSPLIEPSEAPKKPAKRNQTGTQKLLSQYIHDKIENNYVRLIKSLE